jgi:hypothetical protein
LAELAIRVARAGQFGWPSALPLVSPLLSGWVRVTTMPNRTAKASKICAKSGSKTA